MTLDVVTSSYGCDAHEYRPPGDSDDDDDDHTQHFWPLHDEDEDETSEESEEEEDGDVEERMSPLPDDTNSTPPSPLQRTAQLFHHCTNLIKIT